MNHIVRVAGEFEGMLHHISEMQHEDLPLLHYGWPFPTVILLVYYFGVVKGLPRLMENQEPLRLKMSFALWNLSLMLFSVSWAIWISVTVFELYKEGGFYNLICDPEGTIYSGNKKILTYGFLISKFVELGDTLFLALRKKKIIFLQWYHHLTVVIFCWQCVCARSTICTLFGFMNSWIHTFMYWYYFKSSLGYRVWWGKYLTKAQISQMFLGVIFTACWGYYWASGYRCFSDDPKGTLVGAGLMYITYFYLFVDFYSSKHKRD